MNGFISDGPLPALDTQNISRIVVLICSTMLIAGCDQSSTNSANDSTSGDARTSQQGPVNTPPPEQRNTTPAPKPAPPKIESSYQLKIATDVLGTTINLKQPDSDEILKSVQLVNGELSASIEVPSQTDLIVEVSGYGYTNKSDTVNLKEDTEIEVKLDLLAGSEFRELVKSATCLIRIPDGGFGSGFLYGDRQTIVTAAHCVASKNVSELLFTFYPDEDREETFSEAQLVFYDQKQDVAVLRLKEPVSEEHYWLWSSQEAKVGDEVLVMGNPGRNGEYDPMYARTCKVASVRPDELRLDVEIYPGYSGGPVVAEGTNSALGIVSYKIIRSSNYEQVGYSFARSGDIAADAYEQWTGLSDELKERHISRVEDRYSREFGKLLAFNTAAAYYGDSAVYTIICISVMSDYQEYIAKELLSLGPLTLSQQRIVMRRAHKEYLENVAPEIAERVQKRVSPKLRGINVEHDHKVIMEDEAVPQRVKDSLAKAKEAYDELKLAAETIVKKDKKGKSRTADEFLEYIVDLWEDARFNAEEVMDETARR